MRARRGAEEEAMTKNKSCITIACTLTLWASSGFAQEESPTEDAEPAAPLAQESPVPDAEPPAPAVAQAPPGYGVTHRGPSEMAMIEGAAVPDGYVVESRIQKGLVIAGACTFGGVYLLTTLGAAIAVDTSNDDDAYTPLFVPVAGPFIAIHSADANATGTFGLVIDGLAQTAGLSMFIAGLAAQEDVLVWRGGGYAVRPDAGPGGAGLSGTF